MRHPRTSWEEYNREVEAQNEHEKQALRNFKKMQAQPRPLIQSQRAAVGLAWFITKVVLTVAGIALFLWGTFAQVWK